MSPYSKEFEVRYCEINRHREATPLTILKYLEETAISHSCSVGYSVDRLLEDGFGWVLSRWWLVIDKYPLLNDHIIVQTWPSSFERFYANREFVIRDNHGDIIGKACSLWIFLNLLKRRPSRISEQFAGAYGITPARVFEEPFKDLESIQTSDFEKSFSVRKSDIDTNNHVNNTSYVEWMLETVPDEVYNDFVLRSLEVIYKKELSYGAVVNSNCMKINESSSFHTYMHKISTDERVESALGRTMWMKR